MKLKLTETWQKVTFGGGVLCVAVMVAAPTYGVISGHLEANAVYAVFAILGAIGLMMAFVIGPVIYHYTKRVEVLKQAVAELEGKVRALAAK